MRCVTAYEQILFVVQKTFPFCSPILTRFQVNLFKEWCISKQNQSNFVRFRKHCVYRAITNLKFCFLKKVVTRLYFSIYSTKIASLFNFQPPGRVMHYLAIKGFRDWVPRTWSCAFELQSVAFTCSKNTKKLTNTVQNNEEILVQEKIYSMGFYYSDCVHSASKFCTHFFVSPSCKFWTSMHL